MFGFIRDLITRRRQNDDAKTANGSSDAQTTIAQLKARVSQLEDEKKKSEKKSAAQVSEAQAKITRLESKIAELEQEKKSGDTKNAKLLADSLAKAAQLENTVTQLESRITKIEQEKSALQNENKSLQKSNDTLQQEKTALEQKKNELEQKNEKLEQLMSKWQLLERFTPRIAIGGTPPSNQFITVTDSATFRVVEMDYLSSTGAKVASQSVDRSGKGVQIPIDEANVTEIQKLGSEKDGSFSMSFRINIEFDGTTKPFLLPVRVAVNPKLNLEPTPFGIPLKK